jgi:hypothetical protein
LIIYSNSAFTFVAAIIIAAFSIILTQPYSYRQTIAVAQPAMNMTQQCPGLGQTLGGIAVPSGSVCDVVVVRKTPEIMGHNGLVLNKFTLMNSVMEFAAANTTSSSQSLQIRPYM